MKLLLSIVALFTLSIGKESITYTPISHASFVIETAQEVIYVDPTGTVETYSSLPKPTIILITDIHGDHLVPDLIKEIRGTARLIAPEAALEKVEGTVIHNGDTATIGTVHLEAIPMYNTTKERSHFHQKGRGNGYVLTVDGTRVYIAGDTEDIPEMRALTDIDDAFICMNLPYTMTVDQAISATKAFKPTRVFPYHYRGKVDGEVVFSDVSKFKEEIERQTDMQVVLLEWY